MKIYLFCNTKIFLYINVFIFLLIIYSIKNLNNLIIDNKQPKPAFIYYNLVNFCIKYFNKF